MRASVIGWGAWVDVVRLVESLPATWFFGRTCCKIYLSEQKTEWENFACSWTNRVQISYGRQ